MFRVTLVSAPRTAKVSMKSENRLLSHGQETIFNMAAVHHLEFKKIVFGHMTVVMFEACQIL